MILQGELRDFSLPDVLQLLLQQKKSGVLTLTRGKDRQAELFISQGNINGVRIEGRTPETKIQEMVLASGAVDRKDMAALEALSKDMGRPLLSTLSAKGLLSDAQRDDWFQMAAEDMVCDLFAWTEGQYAFSTTQKSLPHALGALRISTEFACMEGMRRIDDWPRLQEALPSENAVFRATGNPLSEESGEWEALVLKAVDGQRSLVRVQEAVPFGAFRLYECILNLWRSGAIEPSGTEEVRQETLAAPPQTEKDLKTALVIGVAAACLVFAAAFRFAGIWFLEGQTPSRPPEIRARAEIALRNAEVFLLQDASERGSFPDELTELVRRGPLTVSEAYGPDGARLRYRKTGNGYELR